MRSLPGSRTLTIAAGMLLLSAAAPAKFYEAQDYDVKLQLDRSGVLTVTEILAFRFVAGPFHYAFREIAAHDTDGITDVHAWIDGQACPIGTEAGEVEINGSSPLMVRWHFPEIISGNHTFILRYRVAGTIRPGDHEQTLVWRVLPQDHEYGIRSSEIVLEYPPGVQPRVAGIRSPQLNFSDEGGQAVLRMNNPGKDVVVEARFPAGSFDSPTPAWMLAREKSARDYENGARWGIGVAVGVLFLATLWMFHLRDAAPPAPFGITVTSPPGSLAPALTALLAGTSGASLGTLLDLARRGVLKIEETKRSRLYGRQFQIVLYDDSARLAPHENVLLESVFKPGETAVTMRDFFSRLTRRRQFPDAVREELRSAGYINPVRETARRKLSIAGFILLLAGLALFVEGLVFDSSFATPVGVSLFVSGFLGLVLAATQPIWSDAGVLVAAQWKAFARYLSKLSRGFELLRDTASFERFLPYAAAFGLAAPFLKQRAKQGGVELPPWFHAMDSADASDAFVAFVSTGDASSSGGGGSGGGGGDASGGGSSGAG